MTFKTSEERIKKRREADRRRRAENPEKYREINRRSKAKNREKINKASRKKHAENPEKNREAVRRSELKNKYGITREDFDRILKSQNGGCAACGTTEPGGRWNTFDIDHCHKTNKVRGLLCPNCNKALGLLKDSPTRIIQLMNYLHRSLTKNVAC